MGCCSAALHAWSSKRDNEHTWPVVMDCSHLQEGGASMAATAGLPRGCMQPLPMQMALQATLCNATL